MHKHSPDKRSKFLHILRALAALLKDVLVTLLIVGGALAAFRWGVMVPFEHAPFLSDGHVTFLRRTGVIATLVLGYWAAAKYYEKRSIPELAFRPVAISIGALSGMALIGATILSLFLLDVYQLHSLRGISAAMPLVSFILVAALVEEFLFRGIVFRLMEKHAGTVIALAIQALLFGGLHLANDGATLLTALSVSLLGALWTAIYVVSRNLWVVAANHFFWNTTIFFSGLPLSGQSDWQRFAPLESSYQGPDLISGGSFGPEDSIISIVITACAFGALTYWAWRHERFRFPG